MSTQVLPIAMLIGMARVNGEQCARELGRAQAAWAQARAQRESLSTYRGEYRDGLGRALANGLPGAGLRDVERFIDALDGALARQRAALAHAGASLARARANWHDAQRRLDALELLAERAERTARQARERVAQREQDEFAMRARIARTATS